MRKIEVYLVTVVGLCLLMMFGCADKHRAFSADSTTSSAAIGSPSTSRNCKAAMMEIPVQRVNLGGVVFESFADTDAHCAYFQFISDGKVSYEESLDTRNSARLLVVQESSNSESLVSKSGVNELGSAVVKFDDDGAPEFVVESGFTGRFHCDVFTLSKHPEKVASFNSGSTVSLVKVGRGVHLLKHLCEYRDAFGALGGTVDVILKWNGATFVLDTEAMCLPPPTKDEIASLTSQFKEQIAFRTDGNVTDLTDPAQLELAPDILDLFYQGRGLLAKRIYNETWPHHMRGKKKYWQSVMKIAAKNEYWSQVKAMNQ